MCRRYGVAELSVFGSVARGDDIDDADVDLLYVLASDSKLGFEIVDLRDDLEKIIGHRLHPLPWSPGIVPGQGPCGDWVDIDGGPRRAPVLPAAPASLEPSSGQSRPVTRSAGAVQAEFGHDGGGYAVAAADLGGAEADDLPGAAGLVQHRLGATGGG